MTTTHILTESDLAALRSEAETSFDSTAELTRLADALEEAQKEGWSYSQALDYLRHAGNIDGEFYDPTESAGAKRQQRYHNCGIGLYVGTYGKYASGDLVGKWWYPADYASAADLMADILDYHHQTETDPELMVQDWSLDNIAGDYLTAGDLGEQLTEWLINFVFDMQEADADDVDKALDYLTANGYSLSDFEEFTDLLRKAEDYCCGYLDANSWNPFQDWVEETFVELYGHEIPDSLTGYIDFERMARDWSYDHTEGKRHVFCH